MLLACQDGLNKEWPRKGSGLISKRLAKQGFCVAGNELITMRLWVLKLMIYPLLQNY